MGRRMRREEGKVLCHVALAESYSDLLQDTPIVKAKTEDCECC